jgi:hypothetical protein
MMKTCICFVMKEKMRVVLAIIRCIRILTASFLVVNKSLLDNMCESVSLVDNKTTSLIDIYPILKS